MLEVWLIVEAEVDATGEVVASSPTTCAMVAALQKAVASYPVGNAVTRSIKADELDILYSKYLDNISLVESGDAREILLCPLTLNLPKDISFTHEKIYQACGDVEGLQGLVDRELGYAIGEGKFWLPVVLTGKGPLYGEAIGLVDGLTESYNQPIHLSDAKRQGLYKLGYGLLQLLSAPPATYLLQFDLQEDDIYFDRLWPFPAAPAIASIGIQSPDLFACHWQCLTNLPIFDISILP
ncbi:MULTISPECIES: hypothetical protein [Aerosakkonema]|uniref:hypothetical protein n=1 Tax=Aerosakkonema TaxID=1246629 RepID=UPI0035BA04FC